MNAENLKRAKNNQDNVNSNINNKKNLCLLFIKSCQSLCNLLFKIKKNTFLLLKKIDQALSNNGIF